MLTRRAFLMRTSTVGAGLAVGLPTRANPGPTCPWSRRPPTSTT